MRGANMSVVRCEVVKRFAARCTDKGVFCNTLVVRFEMSIKACLLGETLIATRALVRFLSSVSTLMSLEAVQAGESLAAGVAQMLFT